MYLEHSVEISAPADVVWAILIDIDHWHEWTDSVTASRRLDDSEPISEGSRVEIRQPRIGKLMWTVTQFTPRVSFTWRATTTGVVTEATHVVTGPRKGPVTLTLTLTQSGPLSPVVEAVGGRRARSYLAMEAAGVKRRAELGGVH